MRLWLDILREPIRKPVTMMQVHRNQILDFRRPFSGRWKGETPSSLFWPGESKVLILSVSFSPAL
jgi:hypothetical protein